MTDTPDSPALIESGPENPSGLGSAMALFLDGATGEDTGDEALPLAICAPEEGVCPDAPELDKEVSELPPNSGRTAWTNAVVSAKAAMKPRVTPATPAKSAHFVVSCDISATPKSVNATQVY